MHIKLMNLLIYYKKKTLEQPYNPVILLLGKDSKLQSHRESGTSVFPDALIIIAKIKNQSRWPPTNKKAKKTQSLNRVYTAHTM